MILAIESREGMSDYFVVPEGFDVEARHKEYNKWYQEAYLQELRKGFNPEYLTFANWLLLVVKGVRLTRDKELVVFEDDF